MQPGLLVYTARLPRDAPSKPRLIGIGGPSCAGKTEVAVRLAALFGAPVVALDAYYRDLAHLPLDERARANFDIPDSLDDQLLIAQVRALSLGQEVAIPVYDFTHHVRTQAVERIQAGEFVIVEGLFTLYWEELRSLLDVKVLVVADDAICLNRRLERDIRERGRSRESVLEQYQRTVRPMAEKYVLPTRRFADLVLDGAGPVEQSVEAVLASTRLSMPGG
jgi:uridine kinase